MKIVFKRKKRKTWKIGSANTSLTFYLQNANCVKLALHLRICSKLRTPFFRIFPFFYVDDQQRRRFIEKRFIKDYNAPLNEDT